MAIKHSMVSWMRSMTEETLTGKLVKKKKKVSRVWSVGDSNVLTLVSSL